MKKARIHRLEKLEYAGAEALNTICSNLSFAGRNQKKIVFSSVSEHEGKSYMTMQIMRNLARRGRRVVLVDADLRMSATTGRYGIEVEGRYVGLAHYLAGHCAMEDAIYETNIPGAYMVLEGRDVLSPIPLLNSREFAQLLSTLADRFDVVLIDAPPIGLVIDAAEIARHCDGAVLVCEYNRTRRRELAAARRQIEQAGCPIMGCVINKVTFDTLSSKKYYHRSYYAHYSSGYYRRSKKD